MKKKRGLSILVLLVLLLTITIGYSLLSTTLNINGTTTISKPTWDIHFANVQVTSGSQTSGSTAPVIATTGADAGLLISYAPRLNQPGDFYEFTADVVNGGTMDAKLGSITLGGVSTAQDVYTNYTVKYSNGTAIAANDSLNAGATRTIRVRVEFDSTINQSQLPTTAQTLNLTCALVYNQA